MIAKECYYDFQAIAPGKGKDDVAFWRKPEGIWQQVSMEGLQDAGMDQHHTGYCWLISYLNCLASSREKYWPGKRNSSPRDADDAFSKKISLQSLIFYDKLEKANWVLEGLLERKDKPLQDREIQYLLTHGCGDQGHWDMAVHLVWKYGIPMSNGARDCWAVQNTEALNDYLKMLLQTEACRLRKRQQRREVGQKELDDIRKEIIDKTARILAIALGMPQKPNMEGRPGCMADYISIICVPGKPSGILLKVPLDGNIVEYGGNTFLNLDQDDFFIALEEQAKQEKFVYIGCDGKRFINQKYGIWDEDSFIFPKWLGTWHYEELSRQEMQGYRLMDLTHAVMLCRSQVINGTKWWLARNTQGSSYGNKGYAAISDKWLRRYVTQAVVKREFIPNNGKFLKEMEVEPWELMI